MRHAESIERNDPAMKDSERTITENGRKAAAQVRNAK